MSSRSAAARRRQPRQRPARGGAAATRADRDEVGGRYSHLNGEGYDDAARPPLCNLVDEVAFVARTMQPENA